MGQGNRIICQTNVIASKIGMVYPDFAWQSSSLANCIRDCFDPLRKTFRTGSRNDRRLIILKCDCPDSGVLFEALQMRYNEFVTTGFHDFSGKYKWVSETGLRE
jgi:hypothetical protein